MKALNSAVKDIMEDVAAGKNLKNNASPLAVKSTNSEKGGGNDLEIISTFEDEVARGDYDQSLNNLMLDGKILNTTRPRIVPDSAIRKIDETAANSEVSSTEKSSPVSKISRNFSERLPVKERSAPVRSNFTSTETSEAAPSKFERAVSYNLPVSGRISSGFGNRFHPIDKKIKFHNGVDIAVPKGTEVKAAADGEVIFAGEKGNYGNVVIIKHADGKETRYGHLDKVLVSVGERVSAGEEVAKSGSTGKSTGPHLHFEVRENGEVVNPFKILSNVLPRTADR